MTLIVTTKFETIIGPEILFECPKCNVLNGKAQTETIIETNSLFWVIPFFSSTYSSIECLNCGEKFSTKYNVDELSTVPKEDIYNDIISKVEFLAKFIIIMSILFGFVPVFGVIFGLGGYFSTRNKPTKWRPVAKFGLSLSIILNITVFILMVKGI